MFCPNYKNKEVFDGFNEMIEAFGGKPMTEEEFRSSELRNQRTGLDFKAMEATYKLYDLNGGNFLDLAPNGKPSLLFLSLLSQYGGNRAKAIIAKSKYYTLEYRNLNEDWIISENDEQDAIKQLFGVSTLELIFNNSTINAVISMAETIGVDMRYVNFEREDTLAAANFIEQTIDITAEYPNRIQAYNKLPEEVAHWWYKLLANTENGTRLRQELAHHSKTIERAKLLKLKNYGKYTSNQAYTEEAIGLLIAEEIKNQEESKDKSWFNKFWKFVKDVISKYKRHKNDPFEEAAIRILNSDISDLIDINQYKEFIEAHPIVFEKTSDIFENVVATESYKIYNKLVLQVKKLSSTDKESLYNYAYVRNLKINKLLPIDLEIYNSGGFDIIPKLLSLDTLVVKYKQGIPLNLEIKLNGAKSIDLVIYNKALDIARNSELYKKSIPVEDFVILVDNILNNEYLLTFCELRMYPYYRIEQTFEATKYPKNVGEADLEDVRHKKIGIWFNHTKPNVSGSTTHSDFAPYAFGSLTYFKDGNHALIHEILSDIFENIREMYIGGSHKELPRHTLDELNIKYSYIPKTLLMVFYYISSGIVHSDRDIVKRLQKAKLWIEDSIENYRKDAFHLQKKLNFNHISSVFENETFNKYLKYQYYDTLNFINENNLNRTNIYIDFKDAFHELGNNDIENVLGDLIHLAFNFKFNSEISFNLFKNQVKYKTIKIFKEKLKKLNSLQKIKKIRYYSALNKLHYIEKLQKLEPKLIFDLYDKFVKNINKIQSLVKIESVTVPSEGLVKSYFYPVVHNLIQTAILEKGRSVKLFFPGYYATMNLQGSEITARIYATPQDVQRGIVKQVGIMYTLLSKMKGIKLNYINNIEGMKEYNGAPVDGYEIDISNYDFEQPLLYGLKEQQLDINGEPINENQFQVSDSQVQLPKFQAATILSIFGDNVISKLNDNYTSSILIERMINSGLLSNYNIEIARVVSKHKVPVVFQELEGNKLMTTKVLKDGQAYIVVDPNKINLLSNIFIADKFLHEVLHAITVPVINNPQTSEQRAFVAQNNSIFKIFNKAFPKNKYSRNTQLYYGLTNEKEFISEFLTNEEFRAAIYTMSRQLDNKDVYTTIKKYINKISRLLLNKNLFSGITEDELKLYDRNIKRYLFNIKPIDNTPLLERFLKIYNSLDENSINNENFIKLVELSDLSLKAIEENDILTFDVNNTNLSGVPLTTKETELKLFILSKSIANMLTKRLAAILNSNLSPLEKENQKQLLSPLIDQFKNYTEDYFKNLSMLIVPISTQLLKDSLLITKLIRNRQTSTDSDYMYLRHANFGVYEKILGEIKALFDHESTKMLLLEQMRNNPNGDEFAIVTDVDKLIDIVDGAYKLAHENYEKTKLLLIQNLKVKFGSLAEELHFVELIDYADNLEFPTSEDTNAMFKAFGSIDRAKDPALRLLHNKVYNAITKADRVTHDKATELLSLVDNLKRGESVRDLYETNEHNQTTGYLIRKYNYGLMYLDYDKFLKKLNISLGLDQGNRVAPKDNEELRKRWNKERNLWLANHVERKYIPEYYEIYSNLSYETQKARTSIQNQIMLIKQNCIGNDGYYHYELLKEEEFLTLLGLYAAKRQLASDYKIDGSLKQEGTVEYIIAKEILELNSKMFPNKNQIKKDEDRWNEARLKVILACGGYQKYKEKSDDFDWERLNEWDDRNSRWLFKINKKTGLPLLLERINDESLHVRLYEVNNDGGERYNHLVEERKKLLNPSRDINSGDPDPRRLSKTIKDRLKKIEDELSIIRKESKKQSIEEKKAAKERRKLFKKYVNFEWSDLYINLYNLAKRRDISLPGYLNLFKLKTGKYTTVDDGFDDNNSDPIIEFRPDPWFTKMVARPEFEEEYMEMAPGDGWINTDDDNNQYLNPNWNESENSAWIPKVNIKRYDNSDKFNKVVNSPTLKTLYDAIFQTLSESNKMMPNRLFHDNYLLPQITGSFLKRIYAQLGKLGTLRAAWSYIKDGVGVIAPNDTDYGETINNILQDVDEVGSILLGEDGPFSSNQGNLSKLWFGEDISGVMPDNRQLNMIPQYYTKKLKDASLLSYDLIGITCEYYNNANKFKNKSQIKDECESIIDYLEDREYVGKKGGTSNTYKMGKKFLEMNLYNIRTQKYTIGNINFGKTGAVFRAFITAINLGLNPVVAATGYFTTMFGHLINGLTGLKYTLQEAHDAAAYVFWHIMKNAGGVRYISNPLSNDKLMICAERFNISNLLLKKYKHSDRPRLFNAINENKTFGFLSTFDFLSKTVIMTSVLMSYKYMDGHFYTEEDIVRNNWASDKTAIKRLKKQRNKCKSLWSVISVKNGKFYINPQYKEAYEEIESIVNARILKYAEAADGMATETQKAQITTNFLGACVLIHRQYFPLMIQDRFGNNVFDPDIQQYTGGTFKTLWDVIKAFVWDGWKDISLKDMSLKSAFTGGVLGSAFGMHFGIVGTIVGSAAGALLGGIKSKQFNKLVNDKSNFNSALSSITKNYQIKQMISEFLAYLLVISNLAMLLNMWAKEPDKKDDKVLQWLAYLTRRVQWETYNPYRLDDMINNFRTPSAALGGVDKFEALFNDVVKSIFPHGSLLDTFLNSDSKTNSKYNSYVQRGIYSKYGLGLFDNPNLEDIKLDIGESSIGLGALNQYHIWSKLERDIFKFMPIHHIFEQYYDSESKNRFFTNQIMNEED